MSPTITTEKCEVAVTVRGRAAYFSVKGNLNGSAPSPKSIVQDSVKAGKNLAIIDLRKADLLDSEGVAWLEQVAALSTASAVKVRVVANAGSKVWRLLELLRFNRFLVIASSLLEALRFGRSRRK